MLLLHQDRIDVTADLRGRGGWTPGALGTSDTPDLPAFRLVCLVRDVHADAAPVGCGRDEYFTEDSRTLEDRPAAALVTSR